MFTNHCTIPIVQVDAFFYYDLARASLQVVDDLVNSSWPEELDFPKCGESMSADQRRQRASINLAYEFGIEAYYGMFGRFVVDEYEFDNNYQEINMRLQEIEIISGRANKIKNIGAWDYSGGDSNLMFLEAVGRSFILIRFLY